MNKTGPKPKCECGTCQRCYRRRQGRRLYHGLKLPASGNYQPQTITMPTDPATLGYLAGLFDGEGALPRNNKSFCVQIAMTDYPVIEWLHTGIGGVMDERKVTGNRKRCWGWRLLRQRDVWAFLLALLPYLRVKRAAAENAICDIWGRELLRGEALDRIAAFERAL